VLVHLVGPAADHAIIGVLLQEGILPGEAFGQRDVIGIHAGDDRGAGFGQQLVEADDQPLVGAEDRADAGIAGGIIFDDRA
jgi:hypothetical protein